MQQPSIETVTVLPENNARPVSTVDPSVSGPENGTSPPREIGGRKGAEPTRFGDWEKNGRCIDF